MFSWRSTKLAQQRDNFPLTTRWNETAKHKPRVSLVRIQIIRNLPIKLRIILKTKFQAGENSNVFATSWFNLLQD
jgi:hypothetical protein